MGTPVRSSISMSRSLGIIWAPTKKNSLCLWGFANNKDADQAEQTCGLMSIFVIHLLESIISKLGTSEMSIS